MTVKEVVKDCVLVTAFIACSNPESKQIASVMPAIFHELTTMSTDHCRRGICMSSRLLHVLATSKGCVQRIFLGCATAACSTSSTVANTVVRTGQLKCFASRQTAEQQLYMYASIHYHIYYCMYAYIASFRLDCMCAT